MREIRLSGLTRGTRATWSLLYWSFVAVFVSEFSHLD
jgi:hypothetical protein